MTGRRGVFFFALLALLVSCSLVAVRASSLSSPFVASRLPGDELVFDVDLQQDVEDGENEDDQSYDQEDDEEEEEEQQQQPEEEQEDDEEEENDSSDSENDEDDVEEEESNEESAEEDEAESDDDDASHKKVVPAYVSEKGARLQKAIAAAQARLSTLDKKIASKKPSANKKGTFIAQVVGNITTATPAAKNASRSSQLENEIAAAQARLAVLNTKVDSMKKKHSKNQVKQVAQKAKIDTIKNKAKILTKEAKKVQAVAQKAAKKAVAKIIPDPKKKIIAAARAAAPSKAYLYEQWHRALIAKMWAAVRRSAHEKNKSRYLRLLRMFNRLATRWAQRRAKLRASLKDMKKNKLRNREKRRQRRELLRKVARSYRKSTLELRSKYEHKYMRYLKLISRYFRRKYKVLVVEYLREFRSNTGLKKALWALRGKLHNSLRAEDLFRKLRLKRLELKRWMDVAKKLKSKLSDAAAKMAQDAGAAKVHAQTSKNLAAAQSNVSGLQKQIADLQKLLAERKAALDADEEKLSKNTASAKAAAIAADKKYTDLLAEYKAALAKHGNLSQKLTEENNALKAEIAKLKNRCIPDVCGVCNGDESSCAIVRSPSTCHAVGDPHYRSFDGYTFNYQVDGEFTLMRHLNDFEVQNLQRLCPNPSPRCNKGMAVRAGSHVIVVYARWGTGTILVDGQKVRTTRGQRVAVDSDVSYTAHANMVDVRYKDAQARAYINPWGNTFYMDLYVTAPPRWSNGRSVSGLCGNFDNNANDDVANIGSATKYWVAGTSRSLFNDPRPRSEADLEMEDNMHAKELQAQSAKIKATLDGAGSVSGLPEHNEKLAFKDPEQRKLVLEKCRNGVHGKDRRDCEFDLLAGAPTKDNRHAFQMTQLLDHEKLLAVCQTVKAAPSLTVAAARLADDEHREGFTVAFWFKPTAEITDNNPHSLLARGTQFAVNTQGENIVARHGEMQCVSPKVLTLDTWTQVVIAVSHKGSITTYINGEASCSEKVDEPPKNEFTDEPLYVVDAAGSIPAAEGFMARLFYLPLTIEERDVARYAHREQPKCSADNAN